MAHLGCSLNDALEHLSKASETLSRISVLKASSADQADIVAAVSLISQASSVISQGRPSASLDYDTSGKSAKKPRGHLAVSQRLG